MCKTPSKGVCQFKDQAIKTHAKVMHVAVTQAGTDASKWHRTRHVS